MKGLHFLRESVPGIGELNDARDCRTMDIDAITDARKAEILRLLDQGVDFDRPTRLFLAEKYSCSEATIVADTSSYAGYE